MAERDTAAPSKLRKLSVVVPVFNERNTLVEIVRRMRAVELPDSVEREIVVVDDGSDDGTRDVLQQLGDSTVRVVHARAQPRQGCGGADRVSRTRPATTSSCRTPTSSTTPKTGRACSRRCSRARRGSCTALGSRANAATCCSSTGSATASSRS